MLPFDLNNAERRILVYNEQGNKTNKKDIEYQYNKRDCDIIL